MLPFPLWTYQKEGKSYKKCASTGNCTFNVNFSRAFDTQDPDDYKITKNSHASYEVYAYVTEAQSGVTNPTYYTVTDTMQI